MEIKIFTRINIPNDEHRQLAADLASSNRQTVAILGGPGLVLDSQQLLKLRGKGIVAFELDSRGKPISDTPLDLS